MAPEQTPGKMEFAQGFTIEHHGGQTVITVTRPWPGAERDFKYLLIPKYQTGESVIDIKGYDAVVHVPVTKMVATSTTHIPALESLGVLDQLVGFPGTQYISSVAARERIAQGKIKELGSNEQINTEEMIALSPEVIFGFGVDGQNKIYNTLQRAHIPVVYNGDWTEETPLGKAEWIKFFAPFFGKEKLADSLFAQTVKTYQQVKKLAAEAQDRPTVISGAMFKDVWYLPGGNSWGAQFLRDANANYLWKEDGHTGSLSLGMESVLAKGKTAAYWMSASQYSSYSQMLADNPHYGQFDAFQNKKVYTYAKTAGETGGLLYYELAPSRPDLVLQDLVHILHPGLLPDYTPYFFKPMDP